MSLVGTLAKVAIGVVIAKGVGSMMQKSGGKAGTGGMFGGANSPQPQAGRKTGLEDMMGDILGGSARQPRDHAPEPGSGGGLGDLLEELSGGRREGGRTESGRRAPEGGGLNDILDQLSGGRGGAKPKKGGGLEDLLGQLTGQSPDSARAPRPDSGGGLGDLLGGILGGAAAGRARPPQGNTRSFGDILNQSFQNRGEPEVAPTPEQNAAAALMLRAMIQAAKSDGKIDAAEKKKLLGNLGDATEAEMRFVQDELSAPVDVEGLARQVPRGLEGQVYTMSVLAIDLDNRNEAEYLHRLATAMGLDQRGVNHIHARLGVPPLYS